MDDFALTMERTGALHPESELLVRARRGDLTAFEELLKQHETQVFRVAYRLLGNPEDARDVAQEVFLRLHSSLSRIDETRQLGAWLYRVTVNAAEDVRRKRRPVVALSYDIAHSGDTPIVHADRADVRRES